LGEDNWGKFRILLNINSEKTCREKNSEKNCLFSEKKIRINYSEFFKRIWLRTIEAGSQKHSNSEFFL
jgi:hypothetical protein